MTIHAHGYWLEISKDNTHVCDYPLCDAMIKMFKVQSAVDIGCGDGAYVFRFMDAHIDCKGYDGSPLIDEMTAGVCEVMDFSQPQDIGKFELVISLEVGEHIPKEFEQVFIDNLCRASSRWICLSWAVPGQPGYGHVNNQTNEYVINEMVKRGFKYCEDLSLRLRKKSTFEWFANTLMVYDSSDK